ncbi:hypothetical protein [Persicirhabdus sediminis]|uniref:Uncharacterized protein n=1 Tax=Persicirhabdus sediminis TaxID=454144 RepID=A0A8J7SJB3_9BACT|nr:hypothetical protein [Persicirhabdus sediminis]MBK1791006.1 hypothetical protein [Persicirhabdus sediminis]
MKSILEFVFNNFALCFGLITLWYVVCFSYLVWKRKKKGLTFPNPTDEGVVFSEFKASGSSHKTIFTRLGGASRCLTVLVTENVLAITTPFPFNLLNEKFDLDHIVPLKNIVSVEQRGNATHLKYTHDDGSSSNLTILLQNPKQFIKSLSQN